MSHVMTRTSAFSRSVQRFPANRLRPLRVGLSLEGRARLAKKVRATTRLLGGVALALGGLAVTGGSFGLFAFIGIPVMAVGLGMITSD